MSRFRDITGQRFGRLTAVRISHKVFKRFWWECVCDCGKNHLADGSNLRSGNTKSCGCLNREKSAARMKTHGKKRTPEYRVWASMLNRCRNPKEMCYPDYGGRGISVCERWLSFENFIADMGRRPDGLTLERKDVNGNYEPGNCKWATWKEQHANKRNSVLLTFGGRTMTQSEWSRSLNYPPKLVGQRLRLGWDFERIATTPPRACLRRAAA